MSLRTNGVMSSSVSHHPRKRFTRDQASSSDDNPVLGSDSGSPSSGQQDDEQPSRLNDEYTDGEYIHQLANDDDDDEEEDDLEV